MTDWPLLAHLGINRIDWRDGQMTKPLKDSNNLTKILADLEKSGANKSLLTHTRMVYYMGIADAAAALAQGGMDLASNAANAVREIRKG